MRERRGDYEQGSGYPMAVTISHVQEMLTHYNKNQKKLKEQSPVTTYMVWEGGLIGPESPLEEYERKRRKARRGRDEIEPGYWQNR